MTPRVRVALVANPRAGGSPDPEALAAALRAHGAEVAVLDVGDAERAADARAWDDGTTASPERVVVAGGDGSIGLAARAAAGAGLPLAVVPLGTANDFARALGLPRERDAACALAADPRASTRPVELALAGERPFVNAASAGLSVLAARRAAPLKRRLGALAYAVGALRAGLRARPLPARAAVDDRPAFTGAAWQVVVAATGAFGGGSALDAADPSDGRLDVAVLAASPRLALARRAWGMRFGGLVEQPGVTHARGRRAEVALPDGTPWNLDGELCALAEPARFSIAPEPVAVVVP